MRIIGFSTGALARGDFRRGLELQRRPDITAVELAALRESEFDTLIDALPDLELNAFKYVSFHAPSKRSTNSERHIVDRLKIVCELNIPIIVHPDLISDFVPWRELGDSILLENMDQRKPVCRTAAEMGRFFKELPDAKLCFDIGHARQVDPTMTVADELLRDFAERLAEVHISEVNEQSRHVAISRSAIQAYNQVAYRIGEEIPVIIESMINCESMSHEIRQAIAAMTPLAVETSSF
ncbi:MAG: hypothetical protein O3A00_10545 [Planctomycetota bacterium]|nr:hypothetical protein [Planctomycetota bacterium]